jgi:hypothetical protein
MFDDKLVFDDEPIYPSPPLAFHKHKFDFNEAQLHKYVFQKQKQKNKNKNQGCKHYIITLSAFLLCMVMRQNRHKSTTFHIQ